MVQDGMMGGDEAPIAADSGIVLHYCRFLVKCQHTSEIGKKDVIS